jgi:mono/diheme cytochrome c family protein
MLTSHLKTVVSCGLFLFFLTLSACSAPSGNPENGQKWFKMNNCGSCHGETGKGGRAPEVTNLDMGFSSFVRKLRKQDAPIMPPFPESKISEQDAADIYAYLKNTK